MDWACPADPWFHAVRPVHTFGARRLCGLAGHRCSAVEVVTLKPPRREEALGVCGIHVTSAGKRCTIVADGSVATFDRANPSAQAAYTIAPRPCGINSLSFGTRVYVSVEGHGTEVFHDTGIYEKTLPRAAPPYIMAAAAVNNGFLAISRNGFTWYDKAFGALGWHPQPFGVANRAAIADGFVAVALADRIAL